MSENVPGPVDVLVDELVDEHLDVDVGRALQEQVVLVVEVGRDVVAGHVVRCKRWLGPDRMPWRVTPAVTR